MLARRSGTPLPSAADRHERSVRDSIFYHESVEAVMRSAFVGQGGLFFLRRPEARVPANHPLRKIGELPRDALSNSTAVCLNGPVRREKP
jgi:hypothetical protein